MERKPFRQQHDLDRHHRYRAPRNNAVECQQAAREDIAALGAAAQAHRVARAAHVFSLRRIADHLERKIGLHRRAHVEGAVAKQRPAAMRALNAAQIGGNAGLQRGIDRFAEIMAQQHVFGRDRRVRFQLEHPMAVGLAIAEQRLGGRGDALVQRGGIVGNGGVYGMHIH